MPKRALLQFISRFCLATAVLGFASCVSLVTPAETPIRIAGVKKQSLVVSVGDCRTEVSGGSRSQSYYGRCRLVYGIPTPILDPKFTLAERLSEQIKAGLEEDGVTVRLSKTGPLESTSVALSDKEKSLTVRLDNVWMDFARPGTNNESILYFEATAMVIPPGARGPRTSVTRKFEKNFRYNIHDSLPNQGIKTLPEFTRLLNDPAIRRALSSN